MKRLQRKTCLIDEALVRKVKRLLGAKSESEAIRKAIGLTVQQEEAARTWSPEMRASIRKGLKTPVKKCATKLPW